MLQQTEAIEEGRGMVAFDSGKDFRELTDIKLACRDTGLLMLGGGVPKNFAQDIVVAAELLNERKGGKAAHQKGTAHEFTSEEARVAGSKGGKAAHQKGTAHQFNSQEAREAGRKGGQASGSQQGGGASSSAEAAPEDEEDGSR